MCDFKDDKLEAEKLIASKKEAICSKTCMKCKEKRAVVVVRIHDPLCRECFLTYSTHKFRSTLGKARLVKANDKVLLALSGGHSSMAMLYFVKEALSEEARKRLKFSPGIVYVDESTLSKSNTDVSSKLADLKDSCGYPFHHVFIYNQRSDEGQLDHKKLENRFKNDFNSITTLTAKNEYLVARRLAQIVSTAKQYGYSKVMIGENATRLSMKLLCNVAQGRGSTIAEDIGVGDYRHEDVTVIRPMREFLVKEIVMYNRLKNIEVFTQSNINTKTDAGSCLQRQTEEFINGLQAEFPSTVNTVFRTGDKICSSGNLKFSHGKCIMCQSPISSTEEEENNSNRKVNNGCCGSSDECNNSKFKLSSKDIIQLLCYGCKLTFKDMGDDSQLLAPDILETASSNIKRLKMKEHIQDFLIE